MPINRFTAIDIKQHIEVYPQLKQNQSWSDVEQFSLQVRFDNGLVRGQPFDVSRFFPQKDKFKYSRNDLIRFISFKSTK